MCPGSRHVENVPVYKYKDRISIAEFPSGKRRVQKDPTGAIADAAFAELGTHSAVAASFRVSRTVVGRWVRDHNLKVTSRPEVGAARFVERKLGNSDDRAMVAQWLMDEGSISVAHYRHNGLTSLIVCGSMNDFKVPARVSHVLGVPITCAKPNEVPQDGWHCRPWNQQLVRDFLCL
jgi:hypothetical protein